MKHRLLVLLRCLSHGNRTVFQNIDGSYTAIQCKGTGLVKEGAEEKNIISRIQYELYGEYPLANKDQDDWDRNVKVAFNSPN